MMLSADILLATINAKWIHPSLALRLLKANLGPLEERCEIAEFALRQPLPEKTGPVLACRPRILGLSVSIWNHTATLELLKELREMWDLSEKTSHKGTKAQSSQRGRKEKEEDLTQRHAQEIAQRQAVSLLKRHHGKSPKKGYCHEESKLALASVGAKDAKEDGEDSRPVVVLGGPEVSYLPETAEIFQYADYVIRGEGELAFRELCEYILYGKGKIPEQSFYHQVNIDAIKSGYRLYTDEDLHKKLVYVEASRGCPFACDFCLSANAKAVREFPLEPFLTEMDELILRGVRTFKFLDRSFNLNIERARRIMEFFLERMKDRTFVAHFEMIPSRFPPELIETLARFPPGSLRLEIGIQTLNPEIAARINRPSDSGRELETLRLLRRNTNAIIHADLIAGLPGEDMPSFGRGFDLLLEALRNGDWGLGTRDWGSEVEIQLGILKLLPGAPIARHTDTFGMCYNPLPPYEVTETAALSAADLDRIKNFARFWELIVNRRLDVLTQRRGDAENNSAPLRLRVKSFENKYFDRFMALSDALLVRFGRNWGIDKTELTAAVHEITEANHAYNGN